MGEIIKLLRQQIDLCRRLLLATERQRQALCDGSGDSMSKETKAIEVLLIELRRIEKRQELLLKGTATHDLAELLSRTAPSEERAVARRLLEETNGIMREMQEAVAMNAVYPLQHQCDGGDACRGDVHGEGRTEGEEAGGRGHEGVRCERLTG